MGSLPFWILVPFFFGEFLLGNDWTMRFQDLTFPKGCSAQAFHLEGSKLKASRNISRIYVFFWSFFLQKKSLIFSTNLSSWPPLMWFLSTFLCFPPKKPRKPCFFWHNAPTSRGMFQLITSLKNSHRPTREILELCRRSRIVPWRRRSSRSKWMWFPVAPCDHWRGMEKPIGGPQR